MITVRVGSYAITQYSSTAMGGPALWPYIIFTLSFNLNLSSKEIKVENM